jgi:multicomponent K+:H+ antiporter subunit C
VEAILAIGIGGMVTSGVYLVLRARTFPVILGLSLLSYAVNLLIAVSGRVTISEWPITDGTSPEYPDPLPQALVLTAIVIGFAMTAFVLVLSLRARYELGSDHVDGRRDEP